MKKLKSFILSLLLIALSNTLVLAQNTGSIKGAVFDKSNGKKIANAQVVIKSLGIGNVTDKNGNFEIKDIPEGEYTIEAKSIGFAIAKLNKVKVAAGKSTNLTFYLKEGDMEVDEVTISATKTDKTVRAIGSQIYVIGAKRIEQTNGRNISEALMEIPGVFTEDTQHSEASVVSFRGVGLHTYVTRGILVLVDGIPITEAMGRTSFEGIDMQNAEKIEVLKGPVSALYGPNGLTGVINVIEKKPQNGLHGDFEALTGSYGTYKIGGNINGGKNGFNYLVKANYYTSDGYRKHSAYESTHLGTKISKDLQEAGKLKFTFDYSLSNSELAGSIDSITFIEDPTANDRIWAGYDKSLYRAYLDYIKTWSNNSALTVDIYTRGRHDEGHYSDRTWGKYYVDLYGTEARYTFGFNLLNQKNSITIGGKFDRETSDFEEYDRDETTGIIENMSNKGNVTYDLTGFYIQDEFNINDKLFLTLGLRYDGISYDWVDEFNEGDRNTSANTTVEALSPKFGFAYNPISNLTVFGNIGKGFNPPTYDQLFIGGRTAEPNPDLKPEYLTNYEIGLRGNLFEKFNYQISYFVMDFTDQVETVPVPDNPYLEKYDNIGDTRHKGVEVSINGHLIDNLSAFVSYSYLDTRYTNSADENLIGQVLRKSPFNQYTIGARYDFDFGLGISADFKFVGKYHMDNENMYMYDGYSLLNAKIMYKWKGMKASFAVNNLLDEKYAARAYAANYRGWNQYYSPGWPINFTFTIAYSF